MYILQSKGNFLGLGEFMFLIDQPYVKWIGTWNFRRGMLIPDIHFSSELYIYYLSELSIPLRPNTD